MRTHELAAPAVFTNSRGGCHGIKPRCICCDRWKKLYKPLGNHISCHLTLSKQPLEVHFVRYSTNTPDRGFSLTDSIFDLGGRVGAGKPEELVEEAQTLSEKARGSFKRQETYRTQFTELTADAVGQSIIQPAATKRDAPGIFSRVEEAAEESRFGAAIPEPLETDPERRGFLN